MTDLILEAQWTDREPLTIQQRIERAAKRLVDAREQFQPCAVVALYSTGGDSSTAVQIATEAFGAKGFKVAMINTGTAIKETLIHAHEQAAENGWDFTEWKSEENVNAKGEPDPQRYEDLVMKYGFPGSFGHGMMYARLKERSLMRLERSLGATADAPVMYVTGMRSEESRKRMGHRYDIQRSGRRVWVAAIHDWRKSDCGDCAKLCGLKQSIVSQHLGRSGECNCGAFAGSGGDGELDEIAFWFPEMGKYLRDLEGRVMEVFPWGWEQEPPQWYLESKRGQELLFDMRSEELPKANRMLCWNCNKETPTK